MLTGLAVGVGWAAVLPAPLPVRLLAVPVAGGSALLPDLDHPSATVARSLGPITRCVARAVNRVALDVYDATRTDLDPPRRNGHRTLTHTVPGAVGFGALVGTVGAVGPLVADSAGWPVWAVGLPVAVVLGFLVGLVGGFTDYGGFGPAVFGSAAAYVVGSWYPGWSWVWPVVVASGALVGAVGDACTPAGVPLCWPVVVAGRRWSPVRTPRTFRTGRDVEVALVTPVLVVGLVVEVGFVTGWLPALAGAVRTVAGG